MSAKRPDLDRLFARESEWDLAAFMAEHLGAIDHRIMWEFGPSHTGGDHQLVLTGEDDVFLRPLIETILERAPDDIGLELAADRPAESVDVATLFVDQQAGVDLRAAAVLIKDGANHRLDLEYFFPGGGSREDLEIAAFIATTRLLGEAVMERWIGEISAKGGGRLKMLSQPAAPIGSVIVGELAAAVTARIDVLRAQLPDTTCASFVKQTEWSALELEPQDAMFGQFDQIAAITPNVALFRATHSGDRFYDERFSRHGETFGYVKIEGGLEASRYADRGEIEDELTEILERHDLGTTVGGGTGTVHSYVELALTDVDTAVDMIVKTLREAGVPNRSWIQFHRADWSREWVGIHADTPRPPMPDD